MQFDYLHKLNYKKLNSVILKVSHKKKKGVANITASNRSKTPPCPGIIAPVSLTPTVLLILDSIRSPITAAGATITPDIPQNK